MFGNYFKSDPSNCSKLHFGFFQGFYRPKYLFAYYYYKDLDQNPVLDKEQKINLSLNIRKREGKNKSASYDDFPYPYRNLRADYFTSTRIGTLECDIVFGFTISPQREGSLYSLNSSLGLLSSPLENGYPIFITDDLEYKSSKRENRYERLRNT